MSNMDSIEVSVSDVVTAALAEANTGGIKVISSGSRGLRPEDIPEISGELSWCLENAAWIASWIRLIDTFGWLFVFCAFLFTLMTFRFGMFFRIFSVSMTMLMIACLSYGFRTIVESLMELGIC